MRSAHTTPQPHAAQFWLMALALLVACGWTASVSAYTLVKRDGQRIVIPDEFTVTPLTLTYEAAPGLNVTIALANLDIAATERANSASAGSLLRRANTAAPSAPSAPSVPARTVTKAAPSASSAPPRTITNNDLATYRRNREAQEAAINRQRAALGQPSLEQEAQQAQDKAALYLAQTVPQRAARRAAEAQNETAWRARAAQWRAAAVALDAQINYAAARLDEIVNNSPSSLYAPQAGYQPGAFYPLNNSFYGGVAGATYGPVGPSLELSQVRPGLAYNWGPGFNNLIQGTQVAPSVDLAANAQAFRRAVAPVRGRATGYPRGYFVVPQVVPVPQNETASADYWRTRLEELRLARVALNARWQTLAEEARRAGVPAEWLRP